AVPAWTALPVTAHLAAAIPATIPAAAVVAEPWAHGEADAGAVVVVIVVIVGVAGRIVVGIARICIARRDCRIAGAAATGNREIVLVGIPGPAAKADLAPAAGAARDIDGLAARNRSDNRVLCTRPGADVEV